MDDLEHYMRAVSRLHAENTRLREVIEKKDEALSQIIQIQRDWSHWREFNHPDWYSTIEIAEQALALTVED